jgi:hypothetical protein
MSSRTSYSRAAKTTAYKKMKDVIRYMQHRDEEDSCSNCYESFNITSSIFDIASLNTVNVYNTKLRQIHIDILRNYLKQTECPGTKCITIPEMFQFIITNPAVLIYNPLLKDAFLECIVRCENNMKNTKNIGDMEMTDDYRSQLTDLLATTKNIIDIYSNINLGFSN